MSKIKKSRPMFSAFLVFCYLYLLLHRERDDLVSSLEQFQSHLDEVQHSFDALSAERNNIEKLYEQVSQ